MSAATTSNPARACNMSRICLTLKPPGCGFPTPGANAGSRQSRSSERYTGSCKSSDRTREPTASQPFSQTSRVVWTVSPSDLILSSCSLVEALIPK
jgi:hypothetical protein